MSRFEGKAAIVTGASRGIGREIALNLANEGARVVVNYSGSKDKADEVVEIIKNAGGEAFAIQADVSNSESVKNMIDETIATFGSIDILVNNAGITRDNLLMRMKEDEW
ncbi:SDR family NAD(P)-dependent oxidoreductase, partial [Microvirga sp. 3-52]|nr:SDR family NAD(P)-dependent oxidoreductase [Microvirga sp. 3-52]